MSTANVNSYHAVIIGSGAGGAAAAYKLANAGLRVAIVEKGNRLPRDASTLDFDKVVHRAIFKSKEIWRDGRGREFAPEEYFNVGGKTKWYGAALLRYGRHEFETDDAHQCVAWPFAYDEMAPYYAEVERLLGVRTFDTERDLAEIIARLRRHSPAWRAEALQMGLKPSIVGNRLEASRFDGFASIADLKADGETTFLSKLRGRSNVALLTGSPVIDLLGDADNPARIVGARLADGRELRASAVLLAAGALHSPRLLSRYLARSALALPCAHNVGRNLKLHLLTALVAISPPRKTDLIRKTTLLLNDSLPHSSVQPLGFDGELIGTLMPPFVPRALARQIGERAYGFFLQTEDGSHPDNRVLGAGSGPNERPVLDYDAARTPAAVREHALLVSSFRTSLIRSGMLAFSERIGLAGTAHASGTLITGTNPATSVVAPDGRVHGLESLYVIDGSVLPRSSRVNPSLTIYAWSTRVAQRLAQQLAAHERTDVTAVAL